MATFVKCENFVEAVYTGLIDCSSDTFKIMLTNTEPDEATIESAADITEISAGGGYSTGGITLDNAGISRTGGTLTFVVDDEVFTATGAVAAFRYAVYIDSTADMILGYVDRGSSLTMAETDEITFNHVEAGFFTAT